MTTATNEDAERLALMRRLREHVSEGLASRFEHAPMEHLRHAVKGCDAQEEFYRLCGLEDASRAPTRAA